MATGGIKEDGHVSSRTLDRDPDGSGDVGHHRPRPPRAARPSLAATAASLSQRRAGYFEMWTMKPTAPAGASSPTIPPSTPARLVADGSRSVRSATAWRLPVPGVVARGPHQWWDRSMTPPGPRGHQGTMTLATCTPWRRARRLNVPRGWGLWAGCDEFVRSQGFSGSM